jgi:hypothetical protein
MARSGWVARVTWALLGLLGAAPACDGLNGDQRGALAVTVVERQPDAGASTPVDDYPDGGAGSSTVVGDHDTGTSTSTVVDNHDAGAPAGCGDYETMCRNYCEALRETGFYSCLSTGMDAAPCTTEGSFYQQCYDLRCAPHLVKKSLCLQQCDALAADYVPYCASATADPAQCTTPPDVHDSACRAGCGACLIP